MSFLNFSSAICSLSQVKPDAPISEQENIVHLLFIVERKQLPRRTVALLISVAQPIRRLRLSRRRSSQVSACDTTAAPPLPAPMHTAPAASVSALAVRMAALGITGPPSTSRNLLLRLCQPGPPRGIRHELADARRHPCYPWGGKGVQPELR